MSIIFPESLPKPLADGFSEGASDPWVEDRSEVGAPRRRARFTRALAQFTFSLTLNDADLEVLKTFYNQTISFGVESFIWEHPTTNETFMVRFSQRFGVSKVSPNRNIISISLDEI